MKFSRLASGDYQATRKDGQVITIYKIEEPWGGDLWGCTYEGDIHGHSNSSAPTKRELVAHENWLEENASDEDLKNNSYM